MNEDKPEASATQSDSDLITQKAFESRTVMIFGEITDLMARDITQRLIALDADSSELVTIFVSSPGGHVESGDSIHDIIRYINSPVRMIGTGWVGSAAAHLFLAAPTENRVCLPNTRFLIHQPSGRIGGKETDIAIQAKEILLVRERIAKTIAGATGKSFEQVILDIDHDHWLSATDAVEYGLVSRIIEHQSDF